MALASAPSTPEQQATLPPIIRRSFTTPIKSASAFQPSQDAEAATAETLFAHHACKIVSFGTPGDFSRRHSSVSDGRFALRDEPTGTLPWASTTERTIAAGTKSDIFAVPHRITVDHPVQDHCGSIEYWARPFSILAPLYILSWQSHSAGASMVFPNSFFVSDQTAITVSNCPT